ncbi:hypothetical protein CRV24_004700 [Beauveria bassiana]|nr:hypothetical protein CRV24_004700 [Beauveria bassiana]KAH8711336.1 hypothetical protein HC256_008148 [Beauveria bassiana]
MAPSLNPTHVAPTSAELELGQYFRNSMIRLFPDELNAEFWQHSMLQASRSVAALWHASNSVAGFRWAEDLRSTGALDAADRMFKESVRQHSISLKRTLLITQSPRLSAQAMTVVLSANALLSLAPDAPGDPQESWRILRANSFRLIRHWKFWEHIDSGPMSTLATQILYYFVKGERLMHESQLVTPEKPLDTWYEAISWLQKYPIASAIRAYVELEMIWSSVRSILERRPLKPTSSDVSSATNARSVLGRQFAAWEARFDTLLSSTVAITSRRRAALGARRILLKVLLRLDLTRFTALWDETCWDEFHSEFSDALDLLVWGLAGEDHHGSKSQDQDVHAFSPLHWNSLNFIARVCREPLLRHRAASLLDASLRAVVRTLLPAKPTEDAAPAGGPLHSPLVVHHIINLEEEAYAECCSEQQKCTHGQFICNMHRVARVQAVGLSANAEYTLHTVGDILENKPGHIVHIGRPVRWS